VRWDAEGGEEGSSSRWHCCLSGTLDEGQASVEGAQADHVLHRPSRSHGEQHGTASGDDGVLLHGLGDSQSTGHVLHPPARQYPECVPPVILIYLSLTVVVIEWACVLFIHRGYYAGAVLHFTLTIPPTYPSQGPSVHFQTDVVHPLIDPSSGKFALGGRFPTWRTGKDYLFMVLFYVKSSFKREALDRLREAGCANLEAYRL
jgi:hypothetical protein